MIPFMGACLGGAGFSLPIRERGGLGASFAPRRNPPVIHARGFSAVEPAADRLARRPANEEHPGYKEQRHWLATPRFFAMRVSKVGPLASVGSITVAACCPMEVAWKCTLHRSAEGSLPVLCALAGSQAHRAPAISKMSGRFANMSFPLNQAVRGFHKLCASMRDGRTGRPGPARGRTRESSSGPGTPAD